WRLRRRSSTHLVPNGNPAGRENTRPFRYPQLIDGRVALMLLYNNVAELRQFRGAQGRAVANRHHQKSNARASAAAAEDLDIEIADFLAQRVAIDAEQIRRPDLVTARGRKRHRQKRMLDLP